MERFVSCGTANQRLLLDLIRETSAGQDEKYAFVEEKDAMQTPKQMGFFSCSRLLFHVGDLRKEIEPWIKTYCRAGSDCLYRETPIGQIL